MFLRRIKQAALQFVLVKPITAVLEIILAEHGLYEEGKFQLRNGYFWIALANNISVSVSLYALVLFYMATEERLKPYSPFIKFLTVKSILFFSYWQSCLFNVLQNIGYIDHRKAQEAYNLIICIEMVIAAFAQAVAFSYEPFVNITAGKSNIIESIGHAITVNDVIEDAHNSFISDI